MSIASESGAPWCDYAEKSGIVIFSLFGPYGKQYWLTISI